MNPFWTQIIVQTTLRQKGKKSIERGEQYSDFVLAKALRVFRITIK